MILRRAAPACLALTAALAATIRAQTPPIPRLESRGFNLRGMDCRRRGKNPRSMNAKKGPGKPKGALSGPGRRRGTAISKISHHWYRRYRKIELRKIVLVNQIAGDIELPHP